MIIKLICWDSCTSPNIAQNKTPKNWLHSDTCCCFCSKTKKLSHFIVVVKVSFSHCNKMSMRVHYVTCKNKSEPHSVRLCIHITLSREKKTHLICECMNVFGSVLYKRYQCECDGKAFTAPKSPPHSTPTTFRSAV